MSQYPYTEHDDGIVLTQPRSGEFERRPMTPAELIARDPALKIAKDIYRHANQAGVCYYEFWVLIAKAIQDALDQNSPSELDIDPLTHPSYTQPEATRMSEVENYIRRLMHSCPTHPDVVRVAIDLNALLAPSPLRSAEEP